MTQRRPSTGRPSGVRSASGKVIDVYEIFWTGGTSGDWNFTHDGDRYLFLVRLENGRYHVLRDWWRSIYPVTSGSHPHLPLDDAHPFWERVALMNWWILDSDKDAEIAYPYFQYSDPGGALSPWRVVKLERGLVRHPSAAVRVPACRELLMLGGWGQDECWEMLSDADRAHLHDSGYRCCSAAEIAATRLKIQRADPVALWRTLPFTGRESRRVLTAINNARLRFEFCRLWEHQYPGDRENGCPSDQAPPVTIVTEQGDVPLVGRWPLQQSRRGSAK
jgi:hypothetical protein